MGEFEGIRKDGIAFEHVLSTLQQSDAAEMLVVPRGLPLFSPHSHLHRKNLHAKLLRFLLLSLFPMRILCLAEILNSNLYATQLQYGNLKFLCHIKSDSRRKNFTQTFFPVYPLIIFSGSKSRLFWMFLNYRLCFWMIIGFGRTMIQSISRLKQCRWLLGFWMIIIGDIRWSKCWNSKNWSDASVHFFWNHFEIDWHNHKTKWQIIFDYGSRFC